MALDHAPSVTEAMVEQTKPIVLQLETATQESTVMAILQPETDNLTAGEDQSSRSKEMVKTEDPTLLKMGKEAEVNGNVAMVDKIGRLVGSSIIPSLCNGVIPSSWK